jgi:hypothetical protein
LQVGIEPHEEKLVRPRYRSAAYSLCSAAILAGAAALFEEAESLLMTEPASTRHLGHAALQAVPVDHGSLAHVPPSGTGHERVLPGNLRLVHQLSTLMIDFGIGASVVRTRPQENVTIRNETNHLSRRALVKLAGITVAGSVVGVGDANGGPPTVVSLFDGKTLDGWIQIENSATSLSSGGITDPAAFAGKLANGPDAMSVFLRGRLQDSVKADLAAYSASSANARAVISALVKDLNQVISGPSIYDQARFGNMVLRPETEQLLKQNPRGQQLARLNTLLLEDAYPGELAKSSSTGWVVKDGAMASTGVGRGVIYTSKDYSRYRLMFTMRHVSGNPDHQACVLVFCSRPQPGEKPLDALGGIQFQVPNAGHWDYRPGMNNGGGQEFTSVTKTQFDIHAWSRVEILADAAKGTARMAVAQPPGNKAVEVLDFKDATAGKVGPIAWQMHNAGLFDEYKDVTIELDPKDDDLIAAK